ncbi:MAG: glycosyltransferase family 8 protein [Gemmatimonadota bacterium]|nr:glycosyltransferase family 8 protein [Gemmatimonadota bacterium]MDE3172739.1 glycosyltransferase family 8 protein [Gemmatimonadota bacterium]MDE3217405.1 glycosyltransferase family 8 protein [Gemmatimonadota bacterium]
MTTPAAAADAPDSSIVIGCGTDEPFAMPTTVTLFAALEHLPATRPILIVVADGGMREKTRRRMRRVLSRASPPVALEIVPVTSRHLAHLPTPGHLGPAAYFRLLLPSIVPDRFAKAIYLDSDLLVRRDLSALWDQPLDGRPLLAVREYSAPVVSSAAGMPEYLEIGLDPETPYLNSGVLVVNLDAWRREEIAVAIADYVAAHRNRNRYGDQDGINAILAGRWGELDLRWNVPAYIGQDRIFRDLEPSAHKEWLANARWTFLREAYVFHFIGAKKPWQPGCALPGQLEWLDAARRCGWFNAWDPRHRAWRALLRADRRLRLLLRRAREAMRAGAESGLPSPPNLR